MNSTINFRVLSLILLAGLTLFTFCNNSKAPSVKSDLSKLLKINIVKKNIHSYKDIEPINDSLVKPIDYLNVISLKDLAVAEKKQHFIDLILPAILIAKEEYKERLRWVNRISKKDTLTQADSTLLTELMTRYRAKSITDLKSRLVTHPTSIVLAQASIESGWGTSRFFVKANNVFGVWSFNKDDPRIPSLSTRYGEHMYLYKYESLSESIDDYFKLLSTRKPFNNFRKMRLKTTDPYKLVESLTAYSELGEKYIQLLKNQIRHNNFTRYDHYKIDPAYISRASEKK